MPISVPAILGNDECRAWAFSHFPEGRYQNIVSDKGVERANEVMLETLMPEFDVESIGILLMEWRDQAGSTKFICAFRKWRGFYLTNDPFGQWGGPFESIAEAMQSVDSPMGDALVEFDGKLEWADLMGVVRDFCQRGCQVSFNGQLYGYNDDFNYFHRIKPSTSAIISARVAAGEKDDSLFGIVPDRPSSQWHSYRTGFRHKNLNGNEIRSYQYSVIDGVWVMRAIEDNLERWVVVADQVNPLATDDEITSLMYMKAIEAGNRKVFKDPADASMDL
jgi:hypothetical protein